MYGCTFIGHKNCSEEIKTLLVTTIKRLIEEKTVTTFYVGTEGNFDKYVYTVLCQIAKEYDIKIIVVLAYLKPKAEWVYYDQEKTIFPDELTKTPIKFAIKRRNSYMIDKAEYLVTYLNTSTSNTYTNVEEAIKKKKKIINLGHYNIFGIEL
ncbi:MAG: hypothetical protein UIG59_05910 [Acutalibacteraceae bacterium]|nr:hypothetical protein [Acutalibacteraceae bacterium]